MFERARRNKSVARWLPSTVGNKTGQGVCSDLEAKCYGQMVIPPEEDGWAKIAYLDHRWHAPSLRCAWAQPRRVVKWHVQKMYHRAC